MEHLNANEQSQNIYTLFQKDLFKFLRKTKKENIQF